MKEVLIPLVAILSPFLMVVAIVVWPKVIRAREQREMQATVRAAIDKGQPLPPELIEAMTKDAPRGKAPSSRLRDIRNGVIWLAVGVGIALFSILNDMGWGGGVSDIDGGMLGIAAIPATVGVAYLILSFFNPNKG